MRIDETLNSLCCNTVWCYGLFWGFDQAKTLQLKLRGSYYEEQIQGLIDVMFEQVHVVGEGLIGQVAFTLHHQWIHSDTHLQRKNSMVSYENLQDSELYTQFCMGIKTIALISVEPWGVVQFGSTQKIPESKEFIEQVKQHFREVRFLENEPIKNSENIIDSTTTSHLTSFLSPDISPSSNDVISNPIQIISQVEDYRLEPTNSSSSTKQSLKNDDSHSSALASFWSRSTSGPDQNMPTEYDDMLNTQNFTSLINQDDCISQKPSSLLTMEELFQESCFSKSYLDPGLENDFSRWLSPQMGLNSSTTASFTCLTSAVPSHSSTKIVPLSSLNGNDSPIHLLDNVPTCSIQRLVPLNPQTKCPGLAQPDKDSDICDEILSPVPGAHHPSNSLFSKLGLGGVSSTRCMKSSCFEDKSGKRGKTDNSFVPGHNQEEEGRIFSSGGEMKSLNRVLDDNCTLAGFNTTRSTEVAVKGGKKKGQPGSTVRPKDRQMIQDRLAELRKLIPSGDKMSIDRLLEQTIRHLNFLHSLITHADSLKQIHNLKSGEIARNQSSKECGGFMWASEVGDQSMVCPLIVKDLDTPGQMLIEILCEEGGFFLEIADIIRGFGLSIFKGVIQVRGAKNTWAHFIVQADESRRVNRHEIFSSVVHLLRRLREKSKIDDGTQSSLSLPINLADGFHCANF